MGRSQETFNKKEIRKRKEKKRKEKEKKRLGKKETSGKRTMDDMIAYVDENGMITSTPPDPSKRGEIAVEDIEISIPPSDPSEKMDRSRKGSLFSLNVSRGFGFIKDAVSGDRIFVHVKNMEDDVSEGNMVSFEVEKGLKGPEAVRVRKI